MSTHGVLQVFEATAPSLNQALARIQQALDEHAGLVGASLGPLQVVEPTVEALNEVLLDVQRRLMRLARPAGPFQVNTLAVAEINQALFHVQLALDTL